jgi:hypothetical protein
MGSLLRADEDEGGEAEDAEGAEAEDSGVVVADRFARPLWLQRPHVSLAADGAPLLLITWDAPPRASLLVRWQRPDGGEGWRRVEAAAGELQTWVRLQQQDGGEAAAAAVGWWRAMVRRDGEGEGAAHVSGFVAEALSGAPPEVWARFYRLHSARRRDPCGARGGGDTLCLCA